MHLIFAALLPLAQKTYLSSFFTVSVECAQTEAVYGLTEIFREEVRAARPVANPGCYPTSIQLPLIPLVKVHSPLLSI